MKLGDKSALVVLSKETIDADGNPIRYQYGINWVEALYPYIIESAGTTDTNWKDYRRCPNSTELSWPTITGSLPSTRMTYAFNFNLLEHQRGMISNTSNLMMLRETDRLVYSICRPTSESTGNEDVDPKWAFLTTCDGYIGQTNPSRHGSGSYVAFADGHVSYFTTEFYPIYTNYTQSWDPVSQQWYNFYYAEPANDTERMLNKSIAITP
jgi:prepilin-type processing-associated H-X9-DG protein